MPARESAPGRMLRSSAAEPATTPTTAPAGLAAAAPPLTLPPPASLPSPVPAEPAPREPGAPEPAAPLADALAVPPDPAASLAPDRAALPAPPPPASLARSLRPIPDPNARLARVLAWRGTLTAEEATEIRRLLQTLPTALVATVDAALPTCPAPLARLIVPPRLARLRVPASLRALAEAWQRRCAQETGPDVAAVAAELALAVAWYDPLLADQLAQAAAPAAPHDHEVAQLLGRLPPQREMGRELACLPPHQRTTVLAFLEQAYPPPLLRPGEQQALIAALEAMPQQALRAHLPQLFPPRRAPAAASTPRPTPQRIVLGVVLLVAFVLGAVFAVAIGEIRLVHLFGSLAVIAAGLLQGPRIESVQIGRWLTARAAKVWPSLLPPRPTVLALWAWCWWLPGLPTLARMGGTCLVGVGVWALERQVLRFPSPWGGRLREVWQGTDETRPFGRERVLPGLVVGAGLGWLALLLGWCPPMLPAVLGSLWAMRAPLPRGTAPGRSLGRGLGWAMVWLALLALVPVGVHRLLWGPPTPSPPLVATATAARVVPGAAPAAPAVATVAPRAAADALRQCVLTTAARSPWNTRPLLALFAHPGGGLAPPTPPTLCAWVQDPALPRIVRTAAAEALTRVGGERELAVVVALARAPQGAPFLADLRALRDRVAAGQPGAEAALLGSPRLIAQVQAWRRGVRDHATVSTADAVVLVQDQRGSVELSLLARDVALPEPVRTLAAQRLGDHPGALERLLAELVLAADPTLPPQVQQALAGILALPATLPSAPMPAPDPP